MSAAARCLPPSECPLAFVTKVRRVVAPGIRWLPVAISKSYTTRQPNQMAWARSETVAARRRPAPQAPPVAPPAAVSSAAPGPAAPVPPSAVRPVRPQTTWGCPSCSGRIPIGENCLLCEEEEVLLPSNSGRPASNIIAPSSSSSSSSSSSDDRSSSSSSWGRLLRGSCRPPAPSPPTRRCWPRLRARARRSHKEQRPRTQQALGPTEHSAGAHFVVVATMSSSTAQLKGQTAGAKGEGFR